MRDGTSSSHRLKPGDVVEVRRPAEILTTLDQSGALEAVPFMPEMLSFVGKRFTVSTRVEKICDTIGPGGSRRMRDTIFLEDLRCDGSAHDGCQAECRIYWKEAWLAKVGPQAAASDASDRQATALDTLVRLNTHVEVRETGEAVFRCQVTEAFRATTAITSVASPTQYVREITSGNVSLGYFLRVALRAISWKIGSRLGLPVGFRRKPPYVKPSADTGKQSGNLELKPGDWVEVKSANEIGSTLNERGYNRGLKFSANEMLPACGRRFRVRRKVEKIIDEKSELMLTLKSCISLEGFTCTGDRTPGFWFCRRHVYPYWRKSWLRQVDIGH